MESHDSGECVEITQPESLRHYVKTCNEIPIDERDIRFLKRHSTAELCHFYANHTALFQENRLMVYLGMGEANAAPCLLEETGLEKQLYIIGQNHLYCFLGEQDLAHILRLEPMKRDAYMEKHRDGMIRLKSISKEMVPRKRNGDELPDPTQKKRLALGKRLDASQQQIISLNVEMALVRQNQVHEAEKHRLELELMQTRHQNDLHVKEIELLRLQNALISAQDSRLARTSHSVPPRFKKIQDWAAASLTDEKYEALRPSRKAKYEGIYSHNKLISYPRLVSLLFVTNLYETSRQPVLQVSLTYRYRLLDVLHLLEKSAAFQTTAVAKEIRELCALCPREYTILLYYCSITEENRESMAKYNSINFSTILFHSQAIYLASEINANNETRKKKIGEKSSAKNEKALANIVLIDPRPGEDQPSIDLLDEYYPLTSFSGPGSFVSPFLRLNLGYKTDSSRKTQKSGGTGIGGGKRCRFCNTRDRYYTLTSQDAQFTHQARTCPLLANLSNNEAVILVALHDALDHKRPGNKDRAERFATCEFLATKDKRFTDSTLLRYATAEELETGEHVGGLRLNRNVFIQMRKTVHELIGYQVKRNPLFATLDKHLVHLASLVLDLPLEKCQNLLAANLLVDNNYQPYFIKPRDFEHGDSLFFSFTPLDGPRTVSVHESEYLEREIQATVIANNYWQPFQ